jgi:hypothetical protein
LWAEGWFDLMAMAKPAPAEQPRLDDAMQQSGNRRG